MQLANRHVYVFISTIQVRALYKNYKIDFDMFGYNVTEFLGFAQDTHHEGDDDIDDEEEEDGDNDEDDDQDSEEEKDEEEEKDDYEEEDEADDEEYEERRWRLFLP